MKIQRFVIAGDNHGNCQNDVLVEKFFMWLDDFKPDIVIHGGDVRDYAALRKKASPEDRTIAIAPDYEAGTDFEKRLFSHGTKRILLRGNHDERIYNVHKETKDAALGHYASKLIHETEERYRKLKVRVYPYDSRNGVLNTDGITSIHGYAAGVGAARRFALIYGTCTYNHTHSMDIAVAEHWPEPSIAYGTGALLNLNQAYNSQQIAKLRHENGWIYGYTDGTSARYFQARFKHDIVYAAETIKIY